MRYRCPRCNHLMRKVFIEHDVELENKPYYLCFNCGYFIKRDALHTGVIEEGDEGEIQSDR